MELLPQELKNNIFLYGSYLPFNKQEFNNYFIKMERLKEERQQHYKEVFFRILLNEANLEEEEFYFNQQYGDGSFKREDRIYWLNLL